MNSRTSSYFFFVLLLGAVVAAALVFLPFLSPLILAIAMAILVYPIYALFSRTMGGGSLARTIAGFATIIGVIIVILVPLFFLVGGIYSEIQSLYATLTDESSRSQVIIALNSLSQYFSDTVFGVLPPHSFDSLNVTDYLKSGLEWVFANLDTIFTGLAKVGGYALVFLLALFYFLRDGAALIKRFISWSPPLEQNEQYIVRTFKKAINSVFAGALVVSVLEGVSTGLALYAFGVPAPALWGTAAAVASLVPGFGASLVIIPAILYLVISGNYTYAVCILIWGYAAIILIDHTLGPMLVNKGVQIHPFLILLSVLGGILTFGIIGFVMGPLILVFLFALLDIYRMTWRSQMK
jgi:predicted PurR-regulated permease PerM